LEQFLFPYLFGPHVGFGKCFDDKLFQTLWETTKGNNANKHCVLWKTVAPSLNKNLFLPPRNDLVLRIFIAAFCFGCLFGILTSNNKLRFPNLYLQFIALLQPTVLSGSLHVKTSLDNRWINNL
jgi:hypothetical protein